MGELQQSLWLTHLVQPDSAAYNLASALRFRGTLDDSKLRQAFDLLVARHRILRSNFVRRGDEVHQIVRHPSPSALEAMTANLVDDLQSAPGIDLADVAHTLQAGRKAFNYRRVLVARDRDDAIQTFAARDAARDPS